MTDNEIIQALECSAEWFEQHGRNTNTGIIAICRQAVGFINRQQAEIERLKAENKSAIDDLKHCMYFAKPKNNNTCNFCSHDSESGSCQGRENRIECNPIWRGLVKEMMGEEE